MCLIVFAWRPEHAQPLIVAANRDEFYARPTLPLGAWEDFPQVRAGRDLEAGGAWLGLGPQGRFAALTNIRGRSLPLGRRSRGDLVAGFLHGTASVTDYLTEIAGRAGEYGGFNLLLGDGQQLWHLHSTSRRAEPVSPGVHGLSNASLDTPWPKLLKARRRLSEHLDDPRPEALLELLADPEPAADAALPDTGVGTVTEKLLSSVFIASPHYGTRASTVVKVDAEGSRWMMERSFGPYGGQLGDVLVEC